jgi:hypothetical protein
MRVLVVNGYNPESKGSSRNYKYFLQTIKELFEANEMSDNYYIEREINELSDYVVDWEHEQLQFTAQLNCEKFDELDFIFIGGDLSILPWEPKSTQVVTLIHMAKYTRKPLIATGYGAFSVIYTLATKGVRYNILNGPMGGTIDSLPDFPYYGVGAGAFPSGWLDHETGDIYTYDMKRKGWLPVCNTGIHFIATAGRPVSKQIHSSGYERPQSHEKRSISGNEPDEDKLEITNLFLSSSLINSLPLSRQFPIRIYQSWYLNRNSALPKGENLLMIADGKCGPNVLIKDRLLLLACRLEPFQNVKYIKYIINNFLVEMKKLFFSADSGRIDLSLHDFLFGKGLTTTILSTIKTTKTVQREKEAAEAVALAAEKKKLISVTTALDPRQVADHSYDTYYDRQNKPMPLSKTFIPTLLPHGPTKVDPPVLAIFYKKPPPSGVTTPHMPTGSIDENDISSSNPYVFISKSKKSTLGRRPKMIVQNPLAARRKRLELAFQAIGMRGDPVAMEKALDDPSYAFDSQMPEAQKDLLSGLAMKESSITVRRHHLLPGGGTDRVGSPTTSLDSPLESMRNTLSYGENPTFQSVLPRSSENSNEFDLLHNNSNNGDNILGLSSLIRPYSRLESPKSKPQTSVSFQPTPPPANSARGANNNNNQKKKAKGNELDSSEDELQQQHQLESEIERDNFSLLTEEEKHKLNQQMIELRNAHNVPVISDWFKVFEQQDIMKQLIEEAKAVTRKLPPPSTAITTMGSQTARSSSQRGGGGSAGLGLLPMSARTVSPASKPSTTTASPAHPPKKPSSSTARSQLTKTPRTMRTMNTCKNVSSLLATANQEFYLPIKHPEAVVKPVNPEYSLNSSIIYDPSATDSPLKMYEEVSRPKMTLGYYDTGSNDSEESLPTLTTGERRDLLMTSGQVHFLPNKTILQKSNYLKMTQILQEKDLKDQKKEYQGIYSEAYTSQEEKKIKDYNKAKEKFLSGNFRTMFASDTMELRKEGGVRPFSEYPKYPGYGYEGLKAADWNLVKGDHKGEFLEGAWK